jgi:hypothetical protein
LLVWFNGSTEFHSRGPAALAHTYIRKAGETKIREEASCIGPFLGVYAILEVPSRDGGTGRRSGLKIRRGSPPVQVQFLFPAPYNPCGLNRVIG